MHLTRFNKIYVKGKHPCTSVLYSSYQVCSSHIPGWAVSSGVVPFHLQNLVLCLPVSTQKSKHQNSLNQFTLTSMGKKDHCKWKALHHIFISKWQHIYFLDTSCCQSSWEKQSLSVAVEIIFFGAKGCCHVRVREAWSFIQNSCTLRQLALDRQDKWCKKYLHLCSSKPIGLICRSIMFLLVCQFCIAACHWRARNYAGIELSVLCEMKAINIFISHSCGLTDISDEMVWFCCLVLPDCK